MGGTPSRSTRSSAEPEDLPDESDDDGAGNYGAQWQEVEEQWESDAGEVPMSDDIDADSPTAKWPMSSQTRSSFSPPSSPVQEAMDGPKMRIVSSTSTAALEDGATERRGLSAVVIINRACHFLQF